MYQSFQIDDQQKTNLSQKLVLCEPHRFFKLKQSLKIGKIHIEIQLNRFPAFWLRSSEIQLILEKQKLWQHGAPMRGGTALPVHCSPLHCLLIPGGKGVLFTTTPALLIFLQERIFFVLISQPELGKQKINGVDRVFQKQIGEHKHRLVFNLQILYRQLSLRPLSHTNTTDSRDLPWRKETCCKE